jgi:uncharacterized membrane protein YphA (DoxX/SURF4 family)
MAHPPSTTRSLELPAWKNVFGTVCAVLLGLLFIVAGVWKITDPIAASVRMTQALVPHALSLPAAIGFGISEAFCGVLLLLPKYRRWGAWITGFLLVAFLVYIGVFYSQLSGEECNCFPWVERAVGPAFFIGDIIMLVMAFFAGWWTLPSQKQHMKSASLILAAVCVFAAASYGAAIYRTTGIEAPMTITANGEPMSLAEGRVFLYFYDPECSHCDFAARDLAKLDWKDTKVVGLATAKPHFAIDFMEETGFIKKAAMSPDSDKLRETFQFVDTPFGAMLENGRTVASFNHFDEKQPLESLRKHGFIE